jgi:CubicO group peptidase (beta-lactamase class C family)
MTALTPALRTSIEDLFAARVRDDQTPGVYFSLFERDDILLTGGFGERRLGGSVPDADTAFRIASCTKSFTSATLLLLRDRGLLNLDAPITDFVPAFRANTPSADPVIPTVRMLMSMSGGLPTDDPWGDRQEAMTPTELASFLEGGVPTVSVPGTAFEYSNLGYALLGQVIAKVTGETYFDAVRSELFEPLGLASTGYERTVVDDDRLALGYRRSGNEWVELPFSSPGVFSAMGGIFSTATDLGRWARWMSSALDPATAQPGFGSAQLGSAKFGSAQLGSAQSRREQQQIHRAIPLGADAASGFSTGYGFGLFVEHDPVWGTTVHHSGGYPGFSTHMRWSAETGIGIVAFENATYSGVSGPASEALRLVLASRGVPDLSPTPWPATLELRARAQQLVSAWDDDLADDLFTDNVAEDVPYSERAAHIARALDLVGAVDWTASPTDVSGNSPAQLTWHLPAARGRLRIDMLLAPTTPALIQRLAVTALPR